MSAKEIVKTLSLYLEMFPEYKLSPTGLKYAVALSKYSVPQIKAAMDNSRQVIVSEVLLMMMILHFKVRYI